MKDKVGAAIETAAKPVPIEMQQIQVTIGSTGRPAILVLPSDVTDGELAEVCGYMLTRVLFAKRAERAKRQTGLVVADSLGNVRPT